MRVVQIGANDGLINDPVNSFLMEYRDQTEVLLIEPQQYLIPALSETYKTHPAHVISNSAVGERGILSLYAIDERCWPDYHAPNAKAWPLYWAPTAVTSSDREHVLRLFRRHYTGPVSADQAIVTLNIECFPLIELLERVGFGRPIDVLQVDAEGADDEVLYQSSLEELNPKLVNFESTHLPLDRMTKLCNFLIRLGYDLQSTGRDTLAIRTDFPPRSSIGP